MKRFSFLILLLAAACARTVPAGPQTVQLVQDILTGKAPHEAGILAAYPQHSSDGDIYIIGARDICTHLGTQMLMADNFDNIDGSPNPDRLPDFAGERIVCVIDQAFTPYDEYTDSLQRLQLRELTVRLMLAAMDTLMSADPVSFELNGRKSRAKMVVFASPELDTCGRWDADSLLHASGAKICLVTPDFGQPDVPDHTARECFREMRRLNLFTHNIAYPSWDALSVADHSGVPVLKKYVQN